MQNFRMGSGQLPTAASRVSQGRIAYHLKSVRILASDSWMAALTQRSATLIRKLVAYVHMNLSGTRSLPVRPDLFPAWLNSS